MLMMSLITECSFSFTTDWSQPHTKHTQRCVIRTLRFLQRVMGM